MFKKALYDTQNAVERRLQDLLESACKDIPPRLAQGMIYGTLKGGKRLRPFLHLCAARLFGGDEQTALDIACSLELIHCYSLIHDDLPGMDNSPLRRGKPSVHTAFDHATAILAGSALQNLAFETITRIDLSASTRLRLIQRLTQASGGAGMMGGQHLDMEAETSPLPLSLKEIYHLQRLKTGALIEYALEAAHIAFAPDACTLEPLLLYGKNFGLAFQITDDLLDLKSDTSLAGKPTQTDHAKTTLLTHYGSDQAEKIVQDLIEQACQSLGPFGDQSLPLQQAIQSLYQRTT